MCKTVWEQASADLIEAIRRIARREPQAGYRSVVKYLKREGWSVNINRIHRLWKQEGLKVPAKAGKRRRDGNSENGAQRGPGRREGADGQSPGGRVL